MMAVRNASVLLFGTLVGISVVLGVAPSSAQDTNPGRTLKVTAEPASMSVAERDALYRKLAQEVADYERQQNILKMAVKLATPTVVHIRAEVRETVRTYARRTIQEEGSGVVIEQGGKFYVLTNRHVIRDAKLADIAIRLNDGRSLTPTRVWGDADTDVAVLAVDTQNLVAARLGNSDQLDIGDMVLAVGSPFGLSHSVTLGIVSAKGRRDLELGDSGVRFQDFIQTDAAINPGNSGGPLLNLRGEVVGINTAIASNSGVSEGVGFSIPINMAMAVAKQLVEHGSVSRAYLGVRLDSKFNADDAIRLGLPRLAGARLLRIEPGSPAESIGLKEGDVVLQFNRIPVDNDAHLVNLVGLTPVGTEVPLIVFRNKQALELKVKVGNSTPTP